MPCWVITLARTPKRQIWRPNQQGLLGVSHLFSNLRELHNGHRRACFGTGPNLLLTPFTEKQHTGMHMEARTPARVPRARRRLLWMKGVCKGLQDPLLAGILSQVQACPTEHTEEREAC